MFDRDKTILYTANTANKQVAIKIFSLFGQFQAQTDMLTVNSKVRHVESWFMRVDFNCLH